MQSDLPKVLHKLGGKPLIRHVIDNVKAAGVQNIIVVVGYKGEEVAEELPVDVQYVWQREQLGTGHAVMQAEEALAKTAGNVLIACGDVPLIRPQTFSLLVKAAEKVGIGAALLTMELENPFGYGRIIKDEAGRFVKITEEKDASDSERLVKEVNTGTYVFNNAMLFAGLKGLKNSNAQQEYYLTDALEHIAKFGLGVNTLMLANPIEGSGVNSKEELDKLETYLRQR